jgi:osmotically inducible lipoprotein OsmB
MKTLAILTTHAVILAVLFGLTACAGMTQREKNTAVGAGVGAVAGSAVTGGSTAGTIGGAAVGGIIGHSTR